MSIANNELWVKSNDGTIVSMYRTTGFTATITSTVLTDDGWTVFTFNKDLNEIGDYAFSGKTGIVDIIIPDTVTSIKMNAFRGCRNITSIVLPSGLTTIGENAFYSCSGLTYIDMPNTVTSLGNGAFYYCSALKEARLSDGLISIGQNAFRSCSRLTTVKWPKELQTIGSYAFNACSLLKTAYLPDTVTTIGTYAFNQCSSLTSVNFPPTVEISSYSFQYCDALQELYIPSGATIGTNVFEGCEGLVRIKVEDGHPVYDSREDCNCMVKTSSNAIVLGSSSSTIPETVTTISRYAFSGRTGAVMIIPDNITSIDEGAFYESKYERIEIGNGVKTIPTYCFYKSTELKSVVIGSGVTSISTNAFYGCQALETIICYATQAPSISSNTFGDIKKNGTLYYPNGSYYGSWLSMGSYYLGYYGWSGSYIGGEIEVPEEDAPDDYWPDSIPNNEIWCKYTGLPFTIYDSSVAQTRRYGPWVIYEYNDDVEILAQGAFFSAKTLTTVILPDSITEIGYQAFRKATNLIDVTMPASLQIIGECAFESCYKLESMHLPAQLTEIRRYAFDQCKALSGSIVIPNGVGVVETYAFRGCSGITSLVLGNGLSIIEDYAFDGCSSLAGHLSVPNSVETIGYRAFAGCDVTAVTFGRNLKSIEAWAFQDCPIGSIRVEALTEPTVAYTSFYDINQGGVLTYPKGSEYDKWMSTDAYYLGYYGWSGKTEWMTDIDENATKELYVKTMDGSIAQFTTLDGFAENLVDTRLTADGWTVFTFDDYISVIGENAFSGQTNIIEVILPSTILGVDRMAFVGCSSLSSITSYAVTAPWLGEYALQNVDRYGALYYPEGSDYSTWMDKLDDNDWYYGYIGTEVVIPERVNKRELRLKNSTGTPVYPRTTNYVWVTDANGNSITPISTELMDDGWYVITFNGAPYKIEDNAFQQKDLVGLVLPEGLQVIGKHAFSYNDSLTEIVVPEGVRIIEDEAFMAWDSELNTVKTIALPSTLESIGGRAFGGMYQLTAITAYTTTAPTITDYTFYDVASYGVLYHPEGADYSSWMGTGKDYLGYYEWFELNIGEVFEAPHVLCTYNIADTANPTKICHMIDGFRYMLVDGVEVELSTGYTFTTAGEHTVKFANKNKKLAYNSFNNCDNLVAAVVSKNITHMSSVFTECGNLRSVEIGPDVVEISSSSFAKCHSLTYIDSKAIAAPNIMPFTFWQVPYHGKLVYPEGADYSSWLNGDEYYLGYYKWNEEGGYISMTYDIKEDGSYSILDLVYYEKMYDVTVDGQSIKEYDDNNIDGYRFPTEIELAAGKHEVRYYFVGGYFDSIATHYDKDYISEITFSKGMKHIGGNFVITPKNYKLSVEDGNEVYDSRNNCNAIIETATNTLIWGTNNTVIPNSVEKLGRLSFVLCDFETITIPNSVKELDDTVFMDCRDLTGITIPDSVEVIGDSCFSHCFNLQEVYIGAGVREIGKTLFAFDEYNTTDEYKTLSKVVVSTGNTVFDSRENCNAIIRTETNTLVQGCPTTVIPDSVAKIGDSAFETIYGLKVISIPNGVKEIGGRAFYNCIGLTSITIPASVEYIGNNALTCGYLSSITCNGTVAPSCTNLTFQNIKEGGTLYFPYGADYSQWLSDNSYYLGYYGWNAGALNVPLTSDLGGEVEEETDHFFTVTHEYGRSITFDAPDEFIFNLVSTEEKADGTTVDIYTLWVESDFSEESASVYISDGVYEIEKIIYITSDIDMASPSINLSYNYLSFPASGGTTDTTFTAEYLNTVKAGVNPPRTTFDDVTIDDYGFTEKETSFKQWHKLTVGATTYERDIPLIFSCVGLDGSSCTEIITAYQSGQTNPIQLTPEYKSIPASGGYFTNAIKAVFSNASGGQQTTVKTFTRAANGTYVPLDGQSQAWFKCYVNSTGGDTTRTEYYDLKVNENTSTEPFMGVVLFRYTNTYGATYEREFYLVQDAGAGEVDVKDPEVQPYVTQLRITADGNNAIETDYRVVRVNYQDCEDGEILAPVCNAEWFRITGSTVVRENEDGKLIQYNWVCDANTGDRARSTEIRFTANVGNTSHIGMVSVQQTYVEPEEPENPSDPDNPPYNPDEPDEDRPDIPSIEGVYIGPIWKDVEFDFGAYEKVEYTVFYGTTLIFTGKAWKRPNDVSNKILVNKICQNYLAQGYLDLESLGWEINVNDFTLRSYDGSQVYHTYRFVNDWSYSNYFKAGSLYHPILENQIGVRGQMFPFSILGAGEQVSIQYGVDYLDGYTDKYGNPIEDWSSTEYITNGVSTDFFKVARRDADYIKTVWIGSNRFKLKESCEVPYVMYYLNPWGGFDWFPIQGKVTRKDRMTPYSYTKNYLNTNIGHGNSRYLSEIVPTFTLNTGWLKQIESDRMWYLLQSNVVYLHDLKLDRIYPVVITDQEVEYKQKTRTERILNYTFNVECAQTRERI